MRLVVSVTKSNKFQFVLVANVTIVVMLYAVIVKSLLFCQ